MGFIHHGARLGRQVILDDPLIYVSNNFRAGLSLLFAPLRSSIDLQLGLSDRPSSVQRWGQSGGGGLVMRLLETTSTPTLVLVFVQMIHLLVVWGLVIVAFVGSIRGRKRAAVGFLALVVLYFVVVAGGPEAYARFRVPLIPFLVAGAGWGVATLRNWRTRNRTNES